MHIPFIARVDSKDPILNKLVEAGIIHKYTDEEISEMLKPVPKDSITPIKINKPEFKLSIEPRYFINPD